MSIASFIKRASGRFCTLGSSTKRNIAKAALMVAFTSSGVKVFGFIRELLVAAIFGISGELDAYLMGVVLVGISLSVVLNAVLTPFVSKAAEILQAGQAERLSILLRQTLGAVLFAVGFLQIIVLILLPELLRLLESDAFDPAQQHKVLDATWWLMPYFVFTAVNLVGYSALQATRSFLSGGFLPVFTHVCVVISIVYGASPDLKWLAIGTDFGAFAEFVALYFILRRKGLHMLPEFPVWQGDSRQLLMQSSPMLVGSVMMTSGPLIEQAFASSLGVGVVSVLSYGIKLPTLLNGLVTAAFGAAVLPFLSSMAADGNFRGLKSTLDFYAKWLFLISFFSAVIFISISGYLVSLVFQRGSFDAAAVAAVVPVQQMYFLQFPGALLAMLGARVLIALGETVKMSGILAAGVMMQIGCAWAAVHWGMGAPGIAASSAVATTLMAIFYIVLARANLCNKTRGV